MALKAGYYVRETASNLRRNFLMTFTAVLTVLISLFMLGGVLLLKGTVSNITLQFRGNVQLSVYLRNDITQAQLDALQKKIQANPEVKNYQFLTHEDAYNEFKKLFQDEPDIIAAVSPDTLPQSFRISLKNPSDESVRAVGQALQGEAGVDEVKYAEQLVKRLFAFTNVVQTLGYAVVAVLAVASILLIANTIRLAIFARRREIGVMKLVGATNWFIRVPFMLEGMLEGLLGGGLAFVAVFVLKIVFFGKVRASVPFLQGLYFDNGQLYWIFAWTVIGGAIVGAVGSAIAVRRFLDV
jgi:cell division transport system permease protein